MEASSEQREKATKPLRMSSQINTFWLSLFGHVCVRGVKIDTDGSFAYVSDSVANVNIRSSSGSDSCCGSAPVIGFLAAFVKFGGELTMIRFLAL